MPLLIRPDLLWKPFNPSIKYSVPMITGKRFGNLLIGDHVSGDEIDKAMQFLNHLKPESVQDFSEINIGNPQNIIMLTPETA